MVRAVAFRGQQFPVFQFLRRAVFEEAGVRERGLPVAMYERYVNEIF